MQSSCWAHPFCENFEVSKLFTSELQNVCKFFTKSNNWCTRFLWLMSEMPDCRKHEGNVRVTLPPWPETKFNRTIGKEENRRVKLNYSKFRTRTHWKDWVRFCSITEQNQTIRITFVYRNFWVSALETINITRSKQNGGHSPDRSSAKTNSLSIYLKSSFVTWSSKPNSSKIGNTGSQN